MQEYAAVDCYVCIHEAKSQIRVLPRPQDMINKGLFSSNSNEWATPTDFYKKLDAEFHFNLDPCATSSNAKCRRFYTIEDDGLTKEWGGQPGLLQSALWEGDWEMGQEVLRGEQELRSCGYAHTSQNRHSLLPRLHLSQGQGDSIHPWSASFQRLKAGSAVPVNGSSILTCN